MLRSWNGMATCKVGMSSTGSPVGVRLSVGVGDGADATGRPRSQDSME